MPVRGEADVLVGGVREALVVGQDLTAGIPVPRGQVVYDKEVE